MAEDEPTPRPSLFWVPIYYRELHESTADWTDEEFGAYMRLLFHQWGHGSIPTEPERIARISASAKRHWKLIGPKFPGGVNPRMARVRAERESQSDRRSEAGRAGNAIRWGSQSDSQSDRNAIATRIASQSQSQSQRSETESKSTSTPPTPLRGEPPAAAVRVRKPKAVDPDPAYDAYPRKVARGAACKAIRSQAATIANSRNIPPSEAIELLAKRAAAFGRIVKRADTEARFIPHPATWFNRGSWDDPDVVAEAERPPPPTNGVHKPTGPVGWTIDRGRGKPVRRLLARDGATQATAIEAAEADPDAGQVDTMGANAETVWRRNPPPPLDTDAAGR